jgi:competence protein ComEC
MTRNRKTSSATNGDHKDYAMPLLLILFSAAVIAVSFFSQLPPLWCLWSLLPLLALCWRWPRLRYVFAFMCGLAWGIYSGHGLIDMQLDEQLVGKDLVVTGRIQGLPEQDGRRLRFDLRVNSIATTSGQLLDVDHFPAKLQLSWYQYQRSGKATVLPALAIGDTWQLRVRLKRPRGFVNPAGFDYQAWLLRQGIGATGYVLDHRTNEKKTGSGRYWRLDDWIDQQRYQLQQWVVARSASSERGILVALLIGDSSLVDKNQWARMQRTGTSHLIAISGLHVGFLAIFGFYSGLLLGKLIQLFWHRCPALFIAWWSAILCASFYSALAGFNIPTVRTLIMLVIFYCACIWRRSIRISDIFCFALASVVVIDPLAALDMGFWLSFGAVALLLIYFSGRMSPKQVAEPWSGFGAVAMLYGFARSQWVMFIGLMVPLSVLVSNISLVAPLANAIAIPLITFIVVPVLLIAAATRDLALNASDFLLACAAWVMEIVKVFLDYLLLLGGSWSSPVVAFSPALAVLIGVSCLILLMPKGLFPRVLGWCGILVGLGLRFFVDPPNEPDLKLTVLDVGQGTAVVVQVGSNTLVYDTGPKYTDNFDAGSGVIVPYLHAQGIVHIDRLVVSHSDMDHAGGMAGLLEKMSADQLLAGQPDKVNRKFDAQNCHETGPWHWQTVSFQFLQFPQLKGASANNHSCVLLIDYAGHTVLLPGDIEVSVENQLLRAQLLPDKLDLLLAAHHGSRTSSGAQFINYIQPDIVVYSAGYRSQHGHPHKEVRKRFQNINSLELNTAEAGAIVFEWNEGSLRMVRESRQARKRYWFD